MAISNSLRIEYESLFKMILERECFDYLQENQSSDNMIKLLKFLVCLTYHLPIDDTDSDITDALLITQASLLDPKCPMPQHSARFDQDDAACLKQAYATTIEQYIIRLCNENGSIKNAYEAYINQLRQQGRLTASLYSMRYVTWWNSLSTDKQTQIKNQIDHIPEAIKKIVRDFTLALNETDETRAYAYYYHLYLDYLLAKTFNQLHDLDHALNVTPSNADTATLLTQQDLRNQIRAAQTDLFLYELSNDLFFLQYYSFHPHHGALNPSLNSDSDEAIVSVVIILSAIVSAIYAAKRLYSVFYNFIHQRKILRSIFILLCFALSFPMVVLVFTTPATSVFKLLIYLMFSAGISTLLAKYTAKIISFFYNRQELNPTSPEKYKLTSAQRVNLLNLGVDLTQFHSLIKTIKDYKQQKFGFWSCFFWTQSHKEKKAFNSVLKALKDGKILGTIKFNGQEFNLSNRSNRGNMDTLLAEMRRAIREQPSITEPAETQAIPAETQAIPAAGADQAIFTLITPIYGSINYQYTEESPHLPQVQVQPQI